MEKLRLILLLTTSLLLLLSGCSEKPKVRVPIVVSGAQVKTPASFHADGCDESLWNHIYNPGRLEVIDRCIAVTGTVTEMKKENDGDYRIHLTLDQGQEILLNQHNYNEHDGALIVRAICQHKDKDKKQECENFNKPIAIPAKGARVRVTGSYVLNRTTINPWAEIYPATSVTPIP